MEWLRSRNSADVLENLAGTLVNVRTLTHGEVLKEKAEREKSEGEEQQRRMNRSMTLADVVLKEARNSSFFSSLHSSTDVRVAVNGTQHRFVNIASNDEGGEMSKACRIIEVS